MEEKLTLDRSVRENIVAILVRIWLRRREEWLRPGMSLRASDVASEEAINNEYQMM